MIRYCLRKGNSTLILTKYDECQNEGEKWSFRKLLEQNISPRDIVKWSSSVEAVDNYARIFYNRSLIFDITNDFLCNCTKLETFGKYCEYKFLHDAGTFDQAIHIQFKMKENLMENQRWASIVCYETLVCDFGLLCLDWRNICDGEQQCIDGLDEDNCDKLEFNECEDEEYRCNNGMCIPDLYFLDGESDCMDASDETIHETIHCYATPLPYDCDEHINERTYWSCGDGQVLYPYFRIPFQTLVSPIYYCLNLRNVYHMCETWRAGDAWTLPNGMCEIEQGYDDPRFGWPPSDLTSEEICIYLLKCALTHAMEYDCPCGYGISCYDLMISICSNPEQIQFPSAGVIRPYLITFFTTKKDYNDKTPAYGLYSGSIKCRGFRAIATAMMDIRINFYQEIQFIVQNQKDYYFCLLVTPKGTPETFLTYFDIDCWNGTRTFNNLLYHWMEACPTTGECISAYRINNGVIDCPRGMDEKIKLSNSSCSKIKRHRFQCSSTDLKCLSPQALTDGRSDCTNRFDLYIYGTGAPLKDITCQHRKDEGCQFLRTYIEESSMEETTDQENLKTTADIRHRAYCDGKWNIYPPMDESPYYCKEWICAEGFFRCKTHQCIPWDWVCDGEWDCSDASDEQGFFLYKNNWNHNQTIEDLDKIITRCAEQYAKQAFSNICNVSIEFPCLLNNVTEPLDINKNRPCIHVSLIGDGIHHCYGGLDERNTALSCKKNMLGYDFFCYENPNCLIIPETLLCTVRCNNDADNTLCFYKSKADTCRDSFDVKCFDGQCQKNARCNTMFECPHGEDEYWCPLQQARVSRHSMKRTELHHRQYKINWPSYPAEQNSTPVLEDVDIFSTKTLSRSDAFDNITGSAFICNRGLSVRSGAHTRCMCSDAYYGNKCEYFSDRITVVTHLNLTYSPYETTESTNVVIKIIASLLFEENKVIDRYEFHITPALEHLSYTKHKFFLVYSRSIDMLNHKRQRYFNRTYIIERHPYSVHFQAFELKFNEITELGAWHYPIYFDYLPSFRLATILYFPKTYLNRDHDSCTNVTCNSNSFCMPYFNQDRSYYCSCKSGFYGPDCRLFEKNCTDHCSPNSICRPISYSLVSGNKQPLCICSLDRFGSRCNLKYDDCYSSPCHNNGSCYHTYDLSGVSSFICKCKKSFYGDTCQKEKSTIEIQITSLSTINDAKASVIQFYDIDNVTFKLILHRQKVAFGLPLGVRFNHDRTQAPVIGLLKLYYDLTRVNYYILYVQYDRAFVNITTTPQQCPHAFSLIEHNEVLAVFKYHQICRNDSLQFCFYDDVYLCICEADRKQAACFNYDPLIDRCDSCLSGGKCIRENSEESNHFICLCPHCYDGRLCEFSMHPFTLTLDSLLAFDRYYIQSVYIIIAFILFAVGFFNNLCSFVTFRRSKPREVGVGSCLLFVTIVNQCALLSLLIKLSYILIGSITGWTSGIPCKILSYILSVCTRSSYWLTSWITVDRLLIVIFPTAQTPKKPRIAIWSSISILFLLLGLHVHEIFFSISIRQPDSNVSLCVLDFGYWSGGANYNRVTANLHHLVPFCIQCISITLLIVLASRQKVKTAGSKKNFWEVLKKQFQIQAELYMTPIIIVLSVLPQTILSFSLTCSQIDNWKRHLLLSTYLLTYIPQVLGFILYVLPSSAYRKEFTDTALGKHIMKHVAKS